MRLALIILFLFTQQYLSNAQAAKGTRYTLNGKAVHEGKVQGYRLDVVDDGTGKIIGENISFVENNRKIIGDVIGKINYAKKKIYFRETKVRNLRVGETQNDYCFFEVTADYMVRGNMTIISGTFVGHSPNGTICGTGQIYLVAQKNVEEIHKVYLKKIEEEKVKASLPKINSTKQIIKKIKPAKIDTPVAIVEPVVTETFVEKVVPEELVKGDVTYEYENDAIMLTICDYDQADDDKIAISINDKIFLDNYILKIQADTFYINLKEFSTGKSYSKLSILALSEGYFSPNSAKIVIIDGDKNHTYYASNDYHKTRNVILRKRKD